MTPTRNIKTSEAATEIAHYIHLVMLFIYILFEIVYELAMEAIKGAKKER